MRLCVELYEQHTCTKEEKILVVMDIISGTTFLFFSPSFLFFFV